MNIINNLKEFAWLFILGRMICIWFSDKIENNKIKSKLDNAFIQINSYKNFISLKKLNIEYDEYKITNIHQ